MRRRGFSLIELLVVVSILAIIATIATYSFNSVNRTAKVKATRASMESLRAMLAEGENSKYGLNLSGSFSGAVPAGVTVDADHTNGQMGRYGLAVLKTHRFLQKLSRIPANRQAFQNLPPESVTNLMWAEGMNYSVGDIVKSNGIFYTCKNDVVGSSTPPPGSDWDTTSAATYVAPLLLDAWHNPIILVGYAQVPSNTQPDTDVLTAYGLAPVNLSGAANRRIVNPPSVFYIPEEWDGNIASFSGYTASDRAKVVSNLSQIYRPFFASAGPDGKLYEGDDNVYSFDE